VVVKSVGFNRFNLLSSSCASSVDGSSFGCVVILGVWLFWMCGYFVSVVILSVYLTKNSVISSLIVGIFKSVCKIL
jgi:hypothetical protein